MQKQVHLYASQPNGRSASYNNVQSDNDILPLRIRSVKPASKTESLSSIFSGPGLTAEDRNDRRSLLNAARPFAPRFKSLAHTALLLPPFRRFGLFVWFQFWSSCVSNEVLITDILIPILYDETEQ